MRVLMIGGTGFIGPPTVQRLAELGHDVTVFHRGADCNDTTHIHGARENIANYRAAFASFRPDVAIDMRAMVLSDAERVLDAIAGIARRAVLVSSRRLPRVRPTPRQRARPA